MECRIISILVKTYSKDDFCLYGQDRQWTVASMFNKGQGVFRTGTRSSDAVVRRHQIHLALDLTVPTDDRYLLYRAMAET